MNVDVVGRWLLEKSFGGVRAFLKVEETLDLDTHRAWSFRLQ